MHYLVLSTAPGRKFQELSDYKGWTYRPTFFGEVYRERNGVKEVAPSFSVAKGKAVIKTVIL